MSITSIAVPPVAEEVIPWSNVGKPRKERRYPNRKKRPKDPRAVERMKKKLEDPEFRAACIARLKKINELPRHLRTYRDGTPDGMTKKKAKKLWDKARETANRIHKKMAEDGIIAELPEGMDDAELRKRVEALTEEQMASLTLREAMVIVLSPYGDAKVRQQAMSTVLQYTKAKPASKIEAKFSNAEAWLEEVADSAKAERS